MYAKMSVLITPSNNEHFNTDTKSYGSATYFMTFSTCCEYLLIYN